MSLVGFLCATVVVPLGLVAARRRANWRYGLASAASALGLAVTVWAAKVPVSWQPSLLDVPLVLGAFVLAAEAIGLPAPIGRRLGFGLHRPEWEFDRQLFGAIARFNASLEITRRTSGDDRRQAISGASTMCERIRDLSAPDEGWQSLANQLAQICDLKLRYLEAGDPSIEREIEDKTRVASRRHQELQNMYQQHPLYSNRK
jgi:hypothetical protein